MSGIAGIWNLDGRPLERGLLVRLNQTLAHRGPDGAGVWIDGPVGLACQLTVVTPESVGETQPRVAASGTVAVYDGRLDNREELLELLGDSAGVGAGSPDLDLILAAYERLGERVFERLNGDFALALYDAARRRLLLARDVFGVRPLYYCRRGNTFLFASEIKTLLAHPDVSARPDDEALAWYLLRSWTIHSPTSTFFEGIHTLPPGHFAVVTEAGVALRRYWDFDPSKRIRYSSFQEYAEHFRGLFEQAVRRRVRSIYPVAVSVSGGLDSSSIFCTAQSLANRGAGAAPLGIHLEYTEGTLADEREYVADIERQYGVAIERIQAASTSRLAGARDAVWRLESPGGLLIEWDTMQRVLETARQGGARVWLSGVWGDQVLGDLGYLLDLVHRLAWRQVWQHLKELPGWMTEADPAHFRRQFFRALVRRHVPEWAVPALRCVRERFWPSREEPAWYSGQFRRRIHGRALRPSSNGFASTAHARSLWQTVSGNDVGYCMEVDGKLAAAHGVEAAYPFLDRDLVSFLMAAPGEVVTASGVYKAILREALRGILPDTIAERRWKADFTNDLNSKLERDSPELEACLASQPLCVGMGYVDGGALEEELRGCRRRLSGNSAVRSWRVLELLGLELWLQVFFGERVRACTARELVFEGR
ncbi:MAG: asparagine synthase-related protein [Acidobacteriota bacterium]